MTRARAKQVSRNTLKFGFCLPPYQHERCPGYMPDVKVVKTNAKGEALLKSGVYCSCGCGHGMCRTCKRRGLVLDSTWQCEDRDACNAFIETRREASPTVRNVRMAQNAGKEARAEKADAKTEADAKAGKVTKKSPKECACGCGKMTKGGMFMPGHDATLKSRLQGVLRDHAHKREDREKARQELKAHRERSGKPGWLSAEDENLDLSAKPTEKGKQEAAQNGEAAKQATGATK